MLQLGLRVGYFLFLLGNASLSAEPVPALYGSLTYIQNVKVHFRQYGSHIDLEVTDEKGPAIDSLSVRAIPNDVRSFLLQGRLEFLKKYEKNEETEENSSSPPMNLLALMVERGDITELQVFYIEAGQADAQVKQTVIEEPTFIADLTLNPASPAVQADGKSFELQGITSEARDYLEKFRKETKPRVVPNVLGFISEGKFLTVAIGCQSPAREKEMSQHTKRTINQPEAVSLAAFPDIDILRATPGVGIEDRVQRMIPITQQSLKERVRQYEAFKSTPVAGGIADPAALLGFSAHDVSEQRSFFLLAASIAVPAP